MEQLSIFWQIIFGTFLTAVVGVVIAKSNSQINLNKVFSKGIQGAFAEIKLLREVYEEKEESRTKTCSFHTEQINELKYRTTKLEKRDMELGEEILQHTIDYEHKKK